MSKRGFTLIELIIVLAIAGLIFLIVFLGISQAQAARRDTERKSDFNLYKAAVIQFQGNHGSRIPSDAEESIIVNFYLGGSANFVDPSTGSPFVEVAGAPTNPGEYNYSPYLDCNHVNSTVLFHIHYFLERGGEFCIDNQ